MFSNDSSSEEDLTDYVMHVEYITIPILLFKYFVSKI